ncbi:MAG: CHASE2 domain-containing protein [Gammaproteobacteria bacterium]
MFRRLRAFLRELSSRFHGHARVSLWLPAAVVLTFAVIEKLDAFGMHEAMEARSEQATLRIVSPYYTPSRDVAVVLVDDDYLKSRGAGWPLRFAEQGRLLRQIASAGPSVILMDFVYPHRHGGGDDIQSLLAPILSSSDETIAHVPIVFTAMAKPLAALPDGFEFCAEELKEHGAPTDILDRESLPTALSEQVQANGRGRFRVGYIRWSRCGGEYPLLLGGDANAPTPVFAAYRAFCESPSHAARCERSDPWDARDFAHPMIVRPGAFPTPEQRFAYSESVCQRPLPARGDVPAGERFLSALQQLTLGVFGDLRRSPSVQLALPCPAVTVLPLSRLQNASRDTWNELLRDKAVILGADISGIPDLVESPVHGQIPGAVWHGMALDNLVALDSNYLAQRHPAIRKYGGFALLLAFAYAFAFILHFLELKAIRLGRAWISFTLWVILALAYVGFGDVRAALFCFAIGVGLDLTSPSTSAVYLVGIAIAAACSALLLRWGVPPGNWLGVVLVAAAFGHALKPYYHASAIRQFPARLSVLRAIFFAIAGRRGPHAEHAFESSHRGE